MLDPQQESSMAQGYQDYFPNMPRVSMEGSQQMYPMPQQPMMQQPIMQYPMMQQLMMQQPMMQLPMMQQPMMQQMMRGFQPQYSFNLINQQQLSLLTMLSYARMMALIQLMSMQNMHQPNQYSGIFYF